jgi:hypothetical protein
MDYLQYSAIKEVAHTIGIVIIFCSVIICYTVYKIKTKNLTK